MSFIKWHLDKILHAPICQCVECEPGKYPYETIRRVDQLGWVDINGALPDMDQIVFLDDGQIVWVGGRSMVSHNEWLWGNTYGNFWYDRKSGLWAGEIEIDDDYQPLRWHPLPG